MCCCLDYVFFSYYGFDEVVVREFLGKKLNKSLRRDLDDIAAKTKKNLKCCQRQVCSTAVPKLGAT